MTEQDQGAADRWNLNFEIAYGRHYTLRVWRFFGRLDGAVTFVELAGGSAVVIALWKDVPWAATTAAICIAVIPLIGRLADFRGKAVKAKVDNSAWMRLRHEGAKLSDADLLERVRSRQSGAELDALKTLAPVAYNDAVAEVGASVDHGYALTPWQKLIASLS